MIPGLCLTYYSHSIAHPGYETLGHQVYKVLCLTITLFGFGIRIMTVGFVPPGTSGRNTEQQIAEKLNTSGMYSVVRHPLYFGNYLMWVGVCMRTYNIWFTIIVSLFFWIYYERIMFAEEQFLRKKYGEAYLKWASSTPTILPNFRNWTRPIYPFNLKKILRQEKTGLLVIFTLFFLLELVEQWNIRTLFTVQFNWTMAFLLSLFVYFLLKYLIHSTTLLNDNM